MPSIQVDLPLVADEDTKQAFAARIGAIYGDIMQVGKDLLTVAIHDLGRGGVWRCHESGPPTPSALIMCDIRKGRPAETRALLAKSLIEACAETFALDPRWLKVEFTQHDGDDMYHPHLGGFNQNWSGDERSDADPM
ncbi:hypothetical protein OHA18_25165 [Kribbella sp. NBC_00709]|uniref:hypothetical protein n=1 Tax=Kribbella sp. NBC_00709 TaxID=2975972 RepID=UPI002E2845D8|nr:hypothetical protein [Kribbella sp. NBC_00709]